MVTLVSYLCFLIFIFSHMAAARAISFAQEHGIRPFILEGDSEAVIKTFMAAEDSLSSFGHIISLAKSTLVTNECISFSHTYRSGNKVAHNLARHARHVRGLTVWMVDAPPHLYFVLFANSS